MKTSKSFLTCSIGIAAVILAAFSLCVLTANITLGDQRQLVSECQIPQDKGNLRLYIIHGSSVTTSDKWIVTYQKSGIRETTIFGAYSSPAIKDIECGQDKVIFIFYPNEPVSIPVTWIKSELIYKPITFYKMELTSPEYQEEVSTWKGVYP